VCMYVCMYKNLCSRSILQPFLNGLDFHEGAMFIIVGSTEHFSL